MFFNPESIRASPLYIFESSQPSIVKELSDWYHEIRKTLEKD